MKQFLLNVTVLISGAIIMLLELTGSRILAPYAGTSLQVWTSLIGIILASLSIGYTLGGKVADKNPNTRIISFIIFFAALFIGVIPILNTIITHIFPFFVHDVKSTALLAAISLFTLPSILLGMISPYIIRLKTKNVFTSGSISGTIYAISTIGSIFGTFFGGYFLISYLGSIQILYFMSFVLLILSLALFSQKVSIEKVGILSLYIMILMIINIYTNIIMKKTNLDIDTNYNRISIFDSVEEKSGKMVRQLRIGNQYSSAMYLNSDDLVYEYTKYYRLADFFHPNIQQALMMGGAAYSYPKDFISKHPKAQLDVVEIDPVLTELAKKYFFLQINPQLTTYSEDGRTFLNRNNKVYDAIFNDAFGTAYSIPFQLSTKEAIQEMYSMLSVNGVVISNVISAVDGEKGKFLRAEYETYKSVFPQVYVLPVQDPKNGLLVQNIMLIALKSKDRSLLNTDVTFNQYLTHIWKKEIKQDISVLTDNFAPVENYTQNLYTFY